ncbi:MAG: sensor histidine kinase protein [Candidatus Scalindua rubra]|uniref:histidine kinase n=1 Tax=Candidatus Scalindua rubra TaxID=1872076 RepID=A0A1E3XB11_9BACT|nr:MAG: sensor histidine kinase protein [Candidatus Scalindua rubra]
MTRGKTTSKRHFPIFTFLFILFVTLVLFLGLGWQSLRSYKDIKTIQERDFRLQKLVGIIIHLDEVLTMSARMGAETGNLQWEERYRSFEPQLDAAIKEAKRLVPETFMSKAATQTDVANIKLVTMQKQAFELVSQGQNEVASALLFSEEYEDQKQIYAEGMKQITASMQSCVNDVLKEHRHRAYITFIVISITLPCLIFAWIYVLRMMRNYIIKRRAAEEGLLESEAQFRSLFEQAAVGIVHVASNGQFLRVNKRFCEITGYTEQEILERTYQDITYPDDLYAQNEARKKILDGETSSYRIEKRYIRKDGTIIWGNLAAGVLIRKPSGEPNYIVSVLEDITERKKAEEELAKHRDCLETLVEERTKELKASQEKLIDAERLAVLGKLSSGIAHEIRNPLGVIDSSAYYLKKKLKDADEKAMTHLDRIINQTRISDDIIQSLQDLTKMKEPQKTRIDIANAIEDGIIISKIPQAVKIIEKVPRDKFFVDVDENQLLMVFNNILNNAVQAMDKKGTIWITADRGSNNWVEVSFKDSGPGITSENLRKIFQSFFGTKAKGLGFGLTICQMIMEKHRGEIEAQSELGEGATFIVRLPFLKQTMKGVNYENKRKNSHRG